MRIQRGKIVVANFMDSSLSDLVTKGVFSSVADTYNPEQNYKSVIHFTPHKIDMNLAAQLAKKKIGLIYHPAAGLSPLKILIALLIVVRTLSKNRVNIVRGRLPYLGSLIGAIAARVLKLPFVVSLGGDNRIVQERNKTYYYGNRFIAYKMEELVFRLASTIIVPNKFTQKYVESIIGPVLAESKCRRIPWISEPVSSYSDVALPSFLTEPNTVRIVPIIGFLNQYKFTDVLYKAISCFISQTDNSGNIKFVFCGDGPLKKLGEAQFMGRSDVCFLGWQDRTIVHELLRRAEFVLIPMSGYVLLESASIGKPVITSEVEWHSEIVRNGVTGITVNPYDPEAWLGAIKKMLNNVNAAKKQGAALRELYWAEYAPDHSVALELKLYEQLCNKKDVKWKI